MYKGNHDQYSRLKLTNGEKPQDKPGVREKHFKGKIKNKGIVMNKMGNFSREIEILTKIQIEILKLKNPISNLKKSFYGLNSRLEITEELMNLRTDQ